MNCIPNSDKCPYYKEYSDKDSEYYHDSSFCLTCEYFTRAPEYDSGSRRHNDILIAHICNKNCMAPEIYKEELEPVMPWE
jgi:hypothetical protein